MSTIYDEKSTSERTEEFANKIVLQIINKLENSEDKKYDIEQMFYMILSQLIYAHKYIFKLPDSLFEKSIFDGMKKDE